MLVASLVLALLLAGCGVAGSFHLLVASLSKMVARDRMCASQRALSS